MTEGTGSCGCGGSEKHSHEQEEGMQKKDMRDTRENESKDVDKSEETGKMGGSEKEQGSEQRA